MPTSPAQFALATVFAVTLVVGSTRAPEPPPKPEPDGPAPPAAAAATPVPEPPKAEPEPADPEPPAKAVEPPRLERRPPTAAFDRPPSTGVIGDPVEFVAAEVPSAVYDWQVSGEATLRRMDGGRSVLLFTRNRKPGRYTVFLAVSTLDGLATARHEVEILSEPAEPVDEAVGRLMAPPKPPDFRALGGRLGGGMPAAERGAVAAAFSTVAGLMGSGNVQTGDELARELDRQTAGMLSHSAPRWAGKLDEFATLLRTHVESGSGARERVARAINALMEAAAGLRGR